VPTPVSDPLQQAISLDLLRMSLAVVFPIGGIGPEPFLVALSLVGSILLITTHLVPLPLCFSGSLTPWLLTKPLISVSWTRSKVITTMIGRDLIHTTTQYGMRIAEAEEANK
jgi:hypothetical protein